MTDPAGVSTFGRAIGINPDNVILEDSTKMVNTATADIIAGRPVLLEDAGIRALTASDNVAIWGLAKFTKNAYIDETRNSYGMYGGGKGTVILKGMVSVRDVSFIKADDTEDVVSTFDTSLTYHVGESLYVNLDAGAKLGLITNVLKNTAVPGRNDNTFVGKVTAVPTTARPVLEIQLA